MRPARLGRLSLCSFCQLPSHPPPVPMGLMFPTLFLFSPFLLLIFLLTPLFDSLSPFFLLVYIRLLTLPGVAFLAQIHLWNRCSSEKRNKQAINMSLRQTTTHLHVTTYLTGQLTTGPAAVGPYIPMSIHFHFAQYCTLST